MLISKGIGIDLGTTNSAVAMMDLTDSNLILYTDKMSRATVPSCVWFDPKKREIVVGHNAFARRGSRPEPITSIKRRMGTQTTVEFGGQQVRPEVISAHILGELRNRIAETLTGNDTESLKYIVERGIVTVPAYFDLPQIEATREAGKLANLDVIELLHEPVAAAVYYSWKHNIPDGTFLIYDLGGGTFDVSVLRRTAGEFEVLGISGDNFLGGDDFDRLLADWIRQRVIEDDYKLDLDIEHNPDDALCFAGLVTLAEQVKKGLTPAKEYQLRDQSTIRDQNNDRVVIDLTISRDTFEGLIRNHIERTMRLCWTALAKAYQKANITLKDIDHICLVGGSTYIPLVQQRVKDSLCNAPNASALTTEQIDLIANQIVPEQREIARKLLSLNERARCTQPAFDEPDTCVALGAAIRAASAGLYVYNDERSVRVFFSGQGTTSKEEYALRGQVESLINDITLDDSEIEIDFEGSIYQQRRKLKEGHFHFKGIPLQGNSINNFALTIYNGQGKAIFKLGHTIVQSSEYRDIGGVLSTAVLSKSILLEGIEQDRLIRGILLPEGTTLPASAGFQFELLDSTGRVRFPLYQSNRKIKDVMVQVDPNLPKGTPVYFSIHCDEQVNLKVGGEIGGEHFDVLVGPPPLPQPPSQQELLALKEMFIQKVHGLPAEESHPLIQIFNATMSDIQEALRAADDAKAISKTADIEGLIKSIDLRTPKLDPPWEVFQQKITEIQQLIEIATDIIKNFDAKAIQRNLEQIVERGRRAQAANDQQEYAETMQALQVFGGSIQQQLVDAKGAKKDVPPEIMASVQLQDIGKKSMALQFFCLVQGRPDLAQKINAFLVDIENKRSLVQDRPHEVTMWCQMVNTELDKAFKELRPEASTEDINKELVSFSGAKQFGVNSKPTAKDLFRK